MDHEEFMRRMKRELFLTKCACIVIVVSSLATLIVEVARHLIRGY